jgi:hypothetical protein
MLVVREQEVQVMGKAGEGQSQVHYLEVHEERR